VLDVSPVTRQVVVGPAESLDVSALVGISPRWPGDVPVGEFACAAQVRAHGEPVRARASFVDSAVRVELLTPVRGVARGQAVVLYDGTRVIGSATIDATTPAAVRG
jgi:tRNA-specific 2-thiouridylase